MTTEGKHIYLYGEKNNAAPLVIINTFEGDGKGIYSKLRHITDKPEMSCLER